MDGGSIVLGIIEGITEFLPVSSTGHLLIVEHWLGHRSETFNVVIQAGAMLAVTIVYRQRLVTLVSGWKESAHRAYAGKLALAFLITALLGFLAKRLGFALPETLAPVAWALLIGGLWMIAVERVSARRSPRTDVTWTVAVAVGLAQIVAGIFPGTSRSAATIFVGMLVGTSDRQAATEFAFLVGIPTMFAASTYELFGSLRRSGGHENWGDLAIAFTASAITAFIAVKWLLGYIKSHRFTAFAIYRFVLGTVLLGVALGTT